MALIFAGMTEREQYMFWIIPAIVGVFFVFKGVIFDQHYNTSVFDYMMLTFIATIFSSLPIMACLGGAAFVGLFFQSRPIEEARYKLTTIRDKDGFQGTFFLGSGQIRGDQYYFYYRRNEDGSVTPDKVSAGQGVRVYEEDREDAELVCFEWETINPLGWLIAMPVNRGGSSFDFHVPKGTIRTGFTM